MFNIVRFPNQDINSLSRAMDTLNLLSFFHITDETEIPIGQKYIAFIDVTEDMITNPAINDYRYDWIIFGGSDPYNKTRVDDFFQTPERIWKDSANGLVHWVISFPQESDTEERIQFDKLIRGLNVKDSRQITFLTGCNYTQQYKEYFETKYNINLGFYNVLFNYTGLRIDNDEMLRRVSTNTKKNVEFICKKEDRPYTGVIYNRMKRDHRILFLSLLKKNNMLNETIWSCGVGHTGDWLYSHFPELKGELSYFFKLENKSAEQLTKQPARNLNENQADVINYDHGMMSYLHIVSESNTTNRTFITEKSYKPFFMMQPFVMLGNAGNVQALRDLGYDVFDKWIDHSYDTEEDSLKRWLMVFDETKKLYSYTKQQWNDLMLEMLPSLIHNAEVAMSPKYHDVGDLVSILMKFYNK